MNLYITADAIGTPTGGGQVTYYEQEALRAISERFQAISIDHSFPAKHPFQQDLEILEKVKDVNEPIGLVHCYAGCLTETVKYLKSVGAKVTYTAAAHDIEISKREHESLNIPYDYPHLTDPVLREKYLGGYLNADALVCPSSHSLKVMQRFGAKQPIFGIPHGVNIPETFTPVPTSFSVGYLGAIGPDKGLKYLLQAWRMLGYKDSKLILAGHHTTSIFMQMMIQHYGGGQIDTWGYVRDISVFYNSICLHCQPSASEGFSLEVLEALSYGRPSIVSLGAGASDCVPSTWVFEAGDVKEIAAKIDSFKYSVSMSMLNKSWQELVRQEVKQYEWPKITERYQVMWRVLMGV